ncbi:hypothetical protein DPMN_021934 [Dreissena polymorpha]|uniref:Uncharacterized protein n=1 Tax=Dreissena polymorpha TaxID=45954 RepID=A0A9D4NPP4_DREPO|nr:hypothetical protein DPMN_021934 [Dreissena polymorpha]
MHGPITNPGAHLGQTFGVGIRVGLCRAISSNDYDDGGGSDDDDEDDDDDGGGMDDDVF